MEGYGNDNPVIIKYPFWRMTAQNPSAACACVNYGDAVCPAEIRDRAICVDGDIGDVIAARKHCGQAFASPAPTPEKSFL